MITWQSFYLSIKINAVTLDIMTFYQWMWIIYCGNVCIFTKMTVTLLSDTRVEYCVMVHDTDLPLGEHDCSTKYI